MAEQKPFLPTGDKKPMKPPKKGGKPKRIGEGMNEPGGPHTPGAKKRRKKKGGM